MKLLKSAAVAVFLFSLSFAPLSLAGDKNEYTVKSFKMLGDEVVSKALNDYSRKNNLEVISCDVADAELVCVFRKSS